MDDAESRQFHLPAVSSQKTENCYAIWWESVLRWQCHRQFPDDVSKAEKAYLQIRVAQIESDIKLLESAKTSFEQAAALDPDDLRGVYLGVLDRDIQHLKGKIEKRKIKSLL